MTCWAAGGATICIGLVGGPFAAAVGEDGVFLSPWKLAVVVAWFLLWVRVTDRVARDAVRWRIANRLWNFAVAAAGLASTAPLLYIGSFPIALFLSLLLFTPAVLGYVWGARNPNVPAEHRLLTDAHLARVGRTALAGVGIVPPPRGEDEDEEVRLSASRSVRRSPLYSRYLPELEDIIATAVKLRATDVQLEAFREKGVVRYRVDAVWGFGSALDREAGQNVLSLAKQFASMDPAEARRVQTGTFEIRIGRRPVSVFGVATGSAVRKRLTLRFADQDSPRGFDKLGLCERDVLTVRAATRQSAGLLLVAGPPMSGKRATLQACLIEVGPSTRTVFALEDPARPMQLPEEVERIVVDPHQPNAFPDGLRLALRSNAKVLVLGRIPDAETAAAVLEAARDRLVLTTIEADNAVAGVFRLFDYGLDRPAVASRLVAVVAQRLPRRLCEQCRESYRPSAEALRRANLRQSGVETLFRARRQSFSQCEFCEGIGYRGCAGLFEVLPLTSRLRTLLQTPASEREIALEARKEGMDTLSEAGLRLAVSGATGTEELRRVLQTAARERVEVC